MRQGLNVLPVRHEYAPGEEPSLIESAVAFFGYEWRMEQYLVAAGLLGLVIVVGFYRRSSKKTRRPDRAAPIARVDSVLGSSMRALRQKRMPGGAGGGGSG